MTVVNENVFMLLCFGVLSVNTNANCTVTFASFCTYNALSEHVFFCLKSRPGIAVLSVSLPVYLPSLSGHAITTNTRQVINQFCRPQLSWSIRRFGTLTTSISGPYSARIFRLGLRKTRL